MRLKISSDKDSKSSAKSNAPDSCLQDSDCIDGGCWFNKCIPTDVIIDCISAALGIVEIAALIENTAALFTVEGALAALKLIGKRYVGWIALGFAVYSFGECMEYWN